MARLTHSLQVFLQWHCSHDARSPTADQPSDPLSLQSRFVAGGVLQALAESTPDGWRLSELTNRVLAHRRGPIPDGSWHPQLLMKDKKGRLAPHPASDVPTRHSRRPVARGTRLRHKRIPECDNARHCGYERARNAARTAYGRRGPDRLCDSLAGSGADPIHFVAQW